MTDKSQTDLKILNLFENALEQPSDLRKTWVLNKPDIEDEVRTAVLSLIDLDNENVPRIRTGGAANAVRTFTPPERIGAYKIVREIGEGGMGVVYEGRRDRGDFEHRVAIKIIRPGLLSPSLIERFRNERRILAKLSHPGIAQLYDGDDLEHGAPYIIMEYVEGHPILDWIEKKSLDQDGILRLFCSILDAIAYAHQNLIVHRDITPSNVLVTENGEPKLIDFGISRPEGSSAELLSTGTQTGPKLSFTPGYAAPEQLVSADSNTLTDIYALGKLLSDMLKGLASNKDLNAIIQMATEDAPSDRYTTIGEFQSDLAAFQAGHGVAARQGGTSYHVSKFVNRHRLATAATVLGSVALFGTFASTLYQFNRAETALGAALTRFEQARALSRTVLFDVYDNFEQIPGTLEPRRDLTNILTDYVQELASDKQAPDDILFDVGTMNMRLGNLYGGIGLSNLGETEKSFERFKAAEAALQALLERDPSNTDALAELVMVKRNLTTQSLYYTLNTDDALAYNNEALKLALNGVAFGDDNERTLLRHYWSSRTDRLQVLLDRSELETALEEVRIWRPELNAVMIDRLGGGEEMVAYLASQEAQILIELERFEDAILPLKAAHEYRKDRLQETPDNYYNQIQFMVIAFDLSRVYRASNQPEQAITYSEAGMEIARLIVEQDPEDTGGPESLVTGLQNLSLAYHAAGNQSEAEKVVDEAILISRTHIANNPTELFYQSWLLDALLTKTKILSNTETVCSILHEAETLALDITQNEASSDDLEQSDLTQLRDDLSKLNCR